MRGEITITDDDSSPTPTVNNPSVAEGNTGLTDLAFDVTLPCPRPAVTFNYRTVADTATASDFTEVGGAPLVFQSCGAGPATTLKPVIKVKGDTLDEPDESFKLELVNPTTGAIVRTATGTITNDDNNSKLSINDASSDEPGTMTFTVTLSQASAREVKVNWATADGTATAGSDYTRQQRPADLRSGRDVEDDRRQRHRRRDRRGKRDTQGVCSRARWASRPPT